MRTFSFEDIDRAMIDGATAIEADPRNDIFTMLSDLGLSNTEEQNKTLRKLFLMGHNAEDAGFFLTGIAIGLTIARTKGAW